MSYSVKHRTQEIRVRAAFGAGTRTAVLLVLRQGFGLVLIGVGIGLVGAILLTRWMSTLHFQVNPTDPLTLAATTLTLLLVALIACCLPARRAARVDPMVALREE